MRSQVGVAPGTLTVNFDGFGNSQLSLVDPYSRHLTSIFPYENRPVRPQFTITPDGRAIPTAAPFMSPSSWQGGEPYRSAAMDAGKVAAAVAAGPLAGVFGATDDSIYTTTKTSMAVILATGLAGIAGGIGGAALATPRGHKANAAGGAAIGSLIGPVGTAVGAVVGAGSGNRLRAGGGAVVGTIVASLAAFFIARAVVA